jgi:Uma2 family endonuclease
MSSIAYSPPLTFPVAAVPPTRKRWSRAEYYRLGEQGWFRDQRVELIDGEIIILSPQSPQHFASLERLRRLLEKAFGTGYWVRPQGPLPHGDYSEPEPDISVVRGSFESFQEQHPSSSVLVVEVSRSTLKYDTSMKQNLYASMAVPDYWVLDLVNRQLLVHRQPVRDEAAPFGHRYQSIATIDSHGRITPLELPHNELTVAELLPPSKLAD